MHSSSYCVKHGVVSVNRYMWGFGESMTWSDPQIDTCLLSPAWASLSQVVYGRIQGVGVTDC